jgi:hypothetical protein
VAAASLPAVAALLAAPPLSALYDEGALEVRGTWHSNGLSRAPLTATRRKARIAQPIPVPLRPDRRSGPPTPLPHPHACPRPCGTPLRLPPPPAPPSTPPQLLRQTSAALAAALPPAALLSQLLPPAQPQPSSACAPPPPPGLSPAVRRTLLSGLALPASHDGAVQPAAAQSLFAAVLAHLGPASGGAGEARGPGCVAGPATGGCEAEGAAEAGTEADADEVEGVNSGLRAPLVASPAAMAAAERVGGSVVGTRLGGCLWQQAVREVALALAEAEAEAASGAEGERHPGPGGEAATEAVAGEGAAALAAARRAADRLGAVAAALQGAAAAKRSS